MAEHSYNNSHMNITRAEDDALYVTVRNAQTSIIPGVCVTGVLGNVLAVGVFLTPTMRKKSCCLYLASKCISDIFFVLSLFVVWLYRVDVPVFRTQGVCQATIFTTYVTGFLSVWFVVLITWENFIRVSFPGHVRSLCSGQRAKYIILAFVVLAIGIYSFSLWTTGLMNYKNDSSCYVFEQYQLLLIAMTYVDSILTLVVPIILLVLLNISIAIGVVNAYKRRRRLFEAIPMTATGERKPPVLERKVSKLLFAVSVIFILLHTPSHIIRIKMIFVHHFAKSLPTLTDMVLQRIFEIMYFLNFSVYCAVYGIFGSKFRAVFKTLYFPKCEYAVSKPEPVNAEYVNPEFSCSQNEMET